MTPDPVDIDLHKHLQAEAEAEAESAKLDADTDDLIANARGEAFARIVREAMRRDTEMFDAVWAGLRKHLEAHHD